MFALATKMPNKAASLCDPRDGQYKVHCWCISLSLLRRCCACCQSRAGTIKLRPASWIAECLKQTSTNLQHHEAQGSFAPNMTCTSCKWHLRESDGVSSTTYSSCRDRTEDPSQGKPCKAVAESTARLAEYTLVLLQQVFSSRHG